MKTPKSENKIKKVNSSIKKGLVEKVQTPKSENKMNKVNSSIKKGLVEKVQTPKSENKMKKVNSSRKKGLAEKVQTPKSVKNSSAANIDESYFELNIKTPKSTKKVVTKSPSKQEKSAQIPDKKRKLSEAELDEEETLDVKPLIKSKKIQKTTAYTEKTIFIGNIPVSTKNKELENLFSEFGKVDFVRMRGITPADASTIKKAALTKVLHANRSSVYAFLRFNDEASVELALTKNGALFKDHHIRVDKAVAEDNSSEGFSIFIGNLPWDVEDEKLYNHFKSCGDIESVRVVRTKDFGASKGIAYVNFKSKDSIELALQHNGKMMMNRPMRVNRALPKKKQEKQEHKMNRRSGKVKADPSVNKSAAEIGKNKEIKNQKVNGTDKKKLDVAHKLAGSKNLAKKSFKSKQKTKPTTV